MQQGSILIAGFFTFGAESNQQYATEIIQQA